MKKTLITFLAVSCCLFASAKTLDVYKVSTFPKIDGNFDDWSSNWVTASEIKVGNSTNNCRVLFQLKYSSDSVYVAVKVDDATPNNDPIAIPSVHNRDCIELFFHFGLADGSIASGSGTSQYRYQRDASQLDAGNVGVNVVSIEKDDDNTGYFQEWALPWQDIADRESFAFSSIDELPQIRFDIQVADNTTATDTRSQQVFWNAATDDQYSSVTNLGFLNLKGLESALPSLQSDAKVYFNTHNSELIISDYSGDINIYNAQGKLFHSVSIDPSNQVIKLNSLERGLYIVSGTGFSSKFIK